MKKELFSFLKPRLALLLAIAMVFSMLPVTVGAADTTAPETTWDSQVSGSFTEAASSLTSYTHYSVVDGEAVAETVTIDTTATLGSKTNPIAISSPEDLILFGKQACAGNYTGYKMNPTYGKYYILTEEVYDMGGHSMLPLTATAIFLTTGGAYDFTGFCGTLIGNGATIQNAYIIGGTSTMYYTKVQVQPALFSSLYGAKVWDLNMKDCTVTGGSGSMGMLYGSATNLTDDAVINVNITGGTLIPDENITSLSLLGGTAIGSTAEVTLGGDYTLQSDLTVRSGETLTIPEGVTLTVAEGTTLSVPTGATLINNGTIVNNGTVQICGSYSGTGTGVSDENIHVHAQNSVTYSAGSQDGYHTATYACTDCPEGLVYEPVEEACTGGTATCTAAAVCENCGASYGTALGHDGQDGVCTVCGVEVFNVTIDSHLTDALTLTSGAYAGKGMEYTGTVVLNSRYYPSSNFGLVISIGGEVTTNFSMAAGVLTIPAEEVTGDILITSIGILERLPDVEPGCVHIQAGALSPYTVDWSEDYSTALLTVHCIFCDETFGYDLTSTCQTVPATCTGTGCYIYSVSYGDIVATTEVEIPIDPDGHLWKDGVCERCSTDCDHSWDADKVCTVCGYVCTHSFSSGICTVCGGYQTPDIEAGEYDDVTWDDTYLISNLGQLLWFADYVENTDSSIKARLTADIDVNPGYTFNADGTVTYGGQTVTEGWRSWDPIGDYSNYNYYTGYFEGNGHTISGLYVNDPEASYVGLFSAICYNPELTELTIANSYFNGNEYVGALAGYAEIYLKKVAVESTVTVIGSSRVGGLIGYTNGGEITNCYSKASVTGTSFTGGLVGYNYNAVTNCYTTEGSLYGAHNSYYGYEVTNSYYLSEEENTSGGKTAAQFASGEVAYLLQSGVAAEDVYDEDGNYVESVTPQIWGQSIDTDGYPTLGGAAVYKNQTGGCTEETYTYEYSNTQADAVHAHAGDEDNDHLCDGCGETLSVCSYENGFCVCGDHEAAELVDGVYQISNAGQLYWFAELVNGGETSASAILTDDIDLESRAWTPIGSASVAYTGTFDGQGNSITNLCMNITAGGDYGLFGYVSGATVRNFSISGEVEANMTEASDVDYGVIGQADSGTTVTNVHSSVNYTCKDTIYKNTVGGIVGRTNSGSITITQCTFSGAIDMGSADVDCLGGIIAYCMAGHTCTVSNCGFYGTITSSSDTSDQVGGIMGYYRGSNLSVTNCLSVGTITLPDYAKAGAIVGILRQHGSANTKVTNNYYYSATVTAFGNASDVTDDITDGYGSQTADGSATSVTSDQLTSGQVAYKLGSAWGQTIGTDSYPTLSSETVYQVLDCDGETVVYSNTNADIPHTYEDFCCQGCGKYLIEIGSVTLTEVDGVKYFTVDGQTLSYTGSFLLSGSTTTNNVTVVSGTHLITMDGLTIDLSGVEGGIALNITGGAVELTLTGENHLSGYRAYFSDGTGCEAIYIGEGTSLTVTAASTGSLSLNGYRRDDNYPGEEDPCSTLDAVNGAGDLIINGGSITNSGSLDCGGVGISGDLTVTGGVLSVGFIAADDISISGGNVTCSGNSGIVYDDPNAGGTYGIWASGNVTITGGAVSAWGPIGCVAISEMAVTKALEGNAIRAVGTVTITGGTVTATGNSSPYALGSLGFFEMGSDSIGGHGIYSVSGSIVITGGNVKVTGYAPGSVSSGYGDDIGTIYSLRTLSAEEEHPAVTAYSMNVAPTDGNGNWVYLNTITLDGITEQTAVTAVTWAEGYGLKDVTTLDTNILYLWLSDSANARKVTTANGDEYAGVITDYAGTFALHTACADEDNDHLCDACGVTVSVCADEDSDHLCDLCGETISQCDYDDNGFCTLCGAYQPCEGEGTEEDPYEIGNTGNLYWFAQQVNGGDADAWAELIDNIVINENVLGEDFTLNEGEYLEWTPMGTSSVPYTGTFDGKNFTISGLYMDMESSNYVGLFGYTSGTVRDLGVQDSFVYGRTNIAAIAGQNNGTVSNCFNTGYVCGDWNVGGVVGSNDGTLEECRNSGRILGDWKGTASPNNRQIGGIVGYSDINSLVTDCSNSGTATGAGQVGGIIGSNGEGCERGSGSISGCYNTGSITGDEVVGGIVGQAVVDISNCYNTGTISSSGTTGGIAGYMATDLNGIPFILSDCYNTGDITGGTYVGGLAGFCSQITDCYNTGKITGSGNYVGGITGYGYIVSNSYNTGTVSGEDYVGGVVGKQSGSEILNCYNIADVTGGSYVGGIAGYGYKVTNCYNIGMVTGESIVGAIAGELIERTNSDSVFNCYYLTGTASVGVSNADAVGTPEAKDDFSTGEVAYLLNGDQSEIVWYQTCGEGYPTFSGKTVYYGYATCSTYTKSYTNFAERPAHVDEDPVDHLCDVCGTTVSYHTPDENANCAICGVELEVLLWSRGYEKLSDALSDCLDTSCVADLTLLRNASGSYSSVIFAYMTYDLNGYTWDMGSGTLYYTAKCDDNMGYATYELTIKDSGTGGKIVTTGDYAILLGGGGSDYPFTATIEDMVQIDSGKADFYLYNGGHLIVNTALTEGAYSIHMDDPGLFAVPGEGVELDESWFTSAVSGYIVTKNDDGSLSLTLCGHSYDDACDATCNLCGTVRTAPHSDPDYTDNRDGTHSAVCDSCGEPLVTNEAHSYGETTHTCACGAVETFTVTWIVDGVETEETYTYGDQIVVPDTDKAADGCTVYTFSGWDKQIPETMPAEDLTFTGSYTTSTVHTDVDPMDGKCDACGEAVAADQIKWQITAGASMEDATTNLRLITFVDTLEDYSKITFTISFVDGSGETRTAELVCDTAYEKIVADGVTLDSAADVFGEGACYFITYTIEGWQQAYFDTDITVTMTRYDLEGNVHSAATRVIKLSDAM